MKRKLISAAVASVLSVPCLLAAGCASYHDDEPRSLTGDNGLPASVQDRYTDQKGHFHPEWVDRNDHSVYAEPRTYTGDNGLPASMQDRYTDQKGHFHSEWVNRDRYYVED